MVKERGYTMSEVIGWAPVRRVRALGGELNARLLRAATGEDGMSTVEYSVVEHYINWPRWFVRCSVSGNRHTRPARSRTGGWCPGPLRPCVAISSMQGA